MSRAAEEEAAYFTLLRAQEERDGLRRYGDYLAGELERLDGFLAAIDRAGEPVPPRMRKPVDRTRKPLAEAVGARRSIVLEEQRRLEDRVEAAEAFVAECERELAALRS